MVPRLVVAGVSSGVGKTTTTIALARAFMARGLRVVLFKCGPDYLDPTYHARATGRPSHNLDGWMMGRDAVLATFQSATRDADLAIVEGVMGLFDGASPTSEPGSTAEIAKWLGAPVFAVIDASGMARTVAAVAHGLATYDPALRVAGVVCNHVGGRGHLDLLREALRSPPVVGGFPRQAALAFPERHLGLRTADEDVAPEATLARWGELAEEWLALDFVLQAALGAAAPPRAEPATVDAPACGPERAAPEAGTLDVGPRCRIGVARDEAFHFYYEDNLRRLERLGVELVPFSPLRDRELPLVDGVYLGGGYPELHAAALSANASMRASVRAFAGAGGPVYAECGGFMYLTRALRTLDGASHEMVGLVEGEIAMRETLVALGYVEVETRRPTLLGGAGLRFRGHQFRYSEFVATAGATGTAAEAYSTRGRHGSEATGEGWTTDNVLGSYVHAHWASNPRIARGLVQSCQLYAAVRARADDRG